VATLSLGGGLVGLIVGTAMADAESRGFLGAVVELFAGGSGSVGFTDILGGWGFVSAGAMLGGFVGALLTELGQRGVVCPRCGTRNGPQAISCDACELTLSRLELLP
jgi:hypothetical protein